MLRREQKIRNIILFTLFSLVFIGVGYAVISSNLTLNGSMTLNKITWDVHFENFEELYDNTVSSTHTLTNNNTSLTYNVNLNKPGDIFEFTIDVVNNGNIDAMLSNIGKNGLTSAQQQVMDYNVTYLDGTIPTVKDSLKIGEVETLVISVKTKANITNAQLNATDTNLSLTFNPTYAQDDNTSTARPNSLYSTIVKDAVPDDSASTYVSKSTGIDFSTSASDSNGKGVYLLKTTKIDDNLIYYFRGAVDNNNVKFNNMCWRIVRTTKNGGIKMIYNGIPDTNGYCSTTTGEDATIGKAKFNNSNSLSYFGYMHGHVYKNLVATYDSSYKYGSSVSYSDGIYTLSSTKSGLDNTHHYTCLGLDEQCEKVSFVHYLKDNSIYYINLENGEKIENAINNMQENIYESNNKIIIDNWFETNLKNQILYLTDGDFCGDRTVSNNAGWTENGPIDQERRYSSVMRLTSSKKPSLACESRDLYSVNDQSGNRKLKYPVALLSADEVMYAGGIYKNSESEPLNYYLGIEESWSLMSPLYFKLGANTYNQYVYSQNMVSSDMTSAMLYIRPVIALKKGIKIASGDGTQNNPYIIN